jgi:hypothetical protein
LAVLGLDEILAGAGFGRKTGILTQIMTLNRPIEPSSELAMSDWVRRSSAMEDILKEGFAQLSEDRLYRNMDRLYGKRAPIEAALREKEYQGRARTFARFPTRLQTGSRRTRARRRWFPQSP